MTVATTPQADRIIARCRELALCTEVPGETTRTFLAPPMHRVHALLGGWMRAAGMQVHVDAAGNLRGLLPAAEPNAPRLLIGSHLDTIANAGAFDGILGVVLAVAVVEQLVDDARTAVPAGKGMPFAIEVIGFSEEEGVRFAKPFLGSLALVGDLDAATLARTDRSGISVADAIRAFGLDPAELPAAVIDPSAFGYLEFHIEQGPVLESEDRALGIVDAIAGQTRMEFIFTGQANHAGTTPMGLRHDALAAAVEWIAAVEQSARTTDQLVATVGSIHVKPNAPNVVPGRALVTLDIRSPYDSVRAQATESLLALAQAIAARRFCNPCRPRRISRSAHALRG